MAKLQKTEFLKKHLHVMILCGGGGKRLWPKSTTADPKQFSRFLGKKTLFQQSLKRARAIADWKNIWIMTHSDYVAVIKKQAPRLLNKNIIAEPMAKNTAMAFLVGAGFIHHRDSEAIIINLHSDTVILNNRQFLKAALAAARIAKEKKALVCLGTFPSFASTAFGYIEKGQPVFGYRDAFLIKSFEEKPNAERAKKLLATKRYLWNFGHYIWSADFVLATAEKLAPEIYKRVRAICRDIGRKQLRKTMLANYENAEKVPIDVAISEKAQRMIVIAVDFAWSDIGDWQSVYSYLGKDRNENAVFADKPKKHLLIDCHRSLLHATGRKEKVIGLIGAEDLLIVETDKALLICKKRDNQKVKDLVEKMQLGNLKKFC